MKGKRELVWRLWRRPPCLDRDTTPDYALDYVINGLPPDAEFLG